MDNTGSIISREDFKDTPHGQYGLWSQELDAAKKRKRKWHKRGDRIVDRYLGKQYGNGKAEGSDKGSTTSLNLFHSNVSLVQAMLFGNLPKVDASRKYADQSDDVARVASEIGERLLNLDIQNNGAHYDSILRAVLQDRLLPGLGCARVRYESEFEDSDRLVVEEIEDTANPGQMLQIETDEFEQDLVYEIAPIEYYHWRDVMWGWSRTWAELPWIGFRSYLSKDQVKARFGKKVAERVEYKTEDKSTDEKTTSRPDENSNWQKAEIWEIWDKDTNQVVWLCIGYDKILDTKEDPMELDDFFPTPPFLMANPTTTLYEPTPDFKLSEDLYNEIDILQTRIDTITDAVKVVGLFNATTPEIQRMFTEGHENDLIPVQDWSMFAESGGLDGAISWYPVQEVVVVLRELITVRDQTIELLYQITGMSDILRGGGTKERESATAQGLKAKFGSARLQGIQDQFATYVGNLMQLKMEVISKHFDAETIVNQSNIQQVTADKQYIEQAVALIKDPDQLQLRISVEAESLAMVDFAQKKQERTEFMQVLTNLLKSAPAFLEMVPGSLPALLEMVQWVMAGFKGSQQIEGVMDQAIANALKQPPKQKDDGGAAKAAADMQKLQAQMQLDQQKHQNAMQLEQVRNQNKLTEMMETLKADMQKIQAKMSADVQEEQLQSEINAEQTMLQTENEMVRDEQQHQNDMTEEDQSHENKMKEINATHAGREAHNEEES